jgi:hypothetical protein
LFAGEKSREVAVVSGVEAIPKKPFGLLTIGCPRRLSYDFSFPVLVADLP